MIPHDNKQLCLLRPFKDLYNQIYSLLAVPSFFRLDFLSLAPVAVLGFRTFRPSGFLSAVHV